jgi:hypothetical protein
MTMPTARLTSTVRPEKTSPVSGSAAPAAANSLVSPFAMPRPAASPISDATVATTSISTKIDSSTWRRSAPIVRSVANSRVRCAIVIESVLKITNAPTKSAIPAKASRKYFRKLSPWVTWFASDCAWSVDVSTCADAGSSGLISRTSCSAATPLFAATEIESNCPSFSNSFCAVGRSKAASVEPPVAETPASAAVPDSRYFCTGPRAETPICSPRWKPWSLAVCLSITTSPARGHRPLSRPSGLNRWWPKSMP